MNEIYLSGKVKGIDQATGRQENAIPHTLIQLAVEHRAHTGEIRSEVFTVHAWRNLALWVQSHIALNEEIALQGHLNSIGSGEKRSTAVTARHIYRCVTEPQILHELAAPENAKEEGGEANGCEPANDP